MLLPSALTFRSTAATSAVRSTRLEVSQEAVAAESTQRR